MNHISAKFVHKQDKIIPGACTKLCCDKMQSFEAIRYMLLFSYMSHFWGQYFMKLFQDAININMIQDKQYLAHNFT